jgi:hypothetical protein
MSAIKWYGLGIVLLCIHLLAQPFTVYSSLERRLLTTKLELSFQDMLDQKFQDSLENLLNDQMLGREWWMKANTLKDTLLGRQIFDKVIVSEFGLHELWLEDNDQLIRNLAFIKAFETKYNGVVALVPHSGSLLENSWHESSVLFSEDGYPALREWLLLSDQKEAFFYQGDHHLNHFATPVMASYVLERLGLDLISPSLKYCGEFSGTLTPYYLTFTPSLDSLWIYDSPIKEMKIGNETYTGLHDLSACDGDNAYQGLLHGNHGLSEITTNSDSGQSLLVIKDSHAHQLMPFLTPHYTNIDVVDLRHYNGSIEALMDSYDDVLVLVGEGSVRDDRNFFKLSR